jgi:diguanylate cyclase (GGDEF)-like protein
MRYHCGTGARQSVETMQTPSTPANEEARVATLRSLNILDTLPEERFDRLTRLARRIFNVPIALVSLVDAERQWFKSNQGFEQATEGPRDESFCAHAILSDELLEVPDALKDMRFFDNPAVTGGLGLRYYAGRPLKSASGMRLGTLCLVDTRPRELTDDEKASLDDLASMAEQEIMAMQLATLDHLTQLTNRRGFEALGRHVLSACQRLGFPLSVIMMDLDGFKAINDTLGHDEGDQALKAFAQLLLDCFRSSDVVARLGGDEFAVLLSNTSEGQARETLRRLGPALDAYNAGSGRGYKLAYSAGVYCEQSPGSVDLAELLRKADQALYEAKRSRAG